MYSEDVMAELVGVPREDIAGVRDDVPAGSWVTDKRKVLWEREGVKALLEVLGIPAEKIPPGWWQDLEKKATKGAEVVRTLAVYRQTSNHGIVLCRLDGAVVRLRIRPTDRELYTQRMLVEAVLERGGLWKARGKPRRPLKAELDAMEGRG